MLRVTIDLLPQGDEAQARTLQTLTITNVGGTLQRGDYTALLSDDKGLYVHRAKFHYWPRHKEKADAAALVAEALRRMNR